MFCRNCGKELTGTREICLNCGAKPLAGNSFCNGCGAPSTPLTEMCVKCGVRLTKAGRGEVKSEGTAMALAGALGFFHILGIGHMYVGRVERGLVLLLTGIALAILGYVFLNIFFGSAHYDYWWSSSVDYEYGWLVPAILFLVFGFGLWIWHIFDARAVCREHNRRVSSGA